MSKRKYRRAHTKIYDYVSEESKFLEKYSRKKPETLSKRAQLVRKGTRQLLTSSQIAKMGQRAISGSEAAYDSLVDFINANVDEANLRLARLEKAQLDYYSPTVYLKSYMDAFDMADLPDRDYDDFDTADMTEVIGQAQAMRRFLTSPLSRVKYAKEYGKRVVDYMVDPEGRIRLQDKLGRDLTTSERRVLQRLVGDSGFMNLIEEQYAQTQELADEVVNMIDSKETIKENVTRISNILTTRLEQEKEYEAYFHTLQ